jgi:hypothetical protein
LRGYLYEQEGSVAEARRDLRRTLDSQPPPPELHDARQRLIERVGTDTGNYDIRALERQMQRLVEGTAAEKIAAEIERRKGLERQLEEHRAFWRTIVGSVLAGCILGAIVWAVVTLMMVRGAH